MVDNVDPHAHEYGYEITRDVDDQRNFKVHLVDPTVREESDLTVWTLGYQ